MPYWSLFCVHCGGYIADALLECVPVWKRSHPAYRVLFLSKPGAAFAWPYCSRLLGFDADGELRSPSPGWPIFRFGRAELEIKRGADGESVQISLPDWAPRHRFTQPGTHLPLTGYLYAEDAASDETVP